MNVCLTDALEAKFATTPGVKCLPVTLSAGTLVLGESEPFIVTMQDAGMEMKMRGAMRVTGKKRLTSPASDEERCPYLSKLDKGIAPDPLPRIPPFLPERSFSTRATFPVRAASSSSWSLPMVRHQAAPQDPAAHSERYTPGHSRPLSTERCPLPRPCLGAEQRSLQSLPDQQEQQQEGGGDSPPPSFTGSFLGGVWKIKEGGGRTRPIKSLPPPSMHAP